MSDRTCSIEGCGRRHYSRGWCKLHLERWKRTGDPHQEPRCSVDGCAELHLARSLCATHYQRWWKGGDPGDAYKLRDPDRTCLVAGCTRVHKGRGYCQMHLIRLRQTGDPGPVAPLLGGSDVQYAAIHHRLRAAFGKASGHACASCDKAADEWAYDHLDPDQRIDSASGHPYSIKLERYMTLCRPCHRKLDYHAARSMGSGGRL